ncbi:MAG TPA: proline racemase family protein [Candidatus Acidoferrales bacterium]|nr:proline racemase family protein [Candidatus Acidoferrales bacterium]
MPERLRYVDSHTGGEPTRLVLEGFPDLTALPLRERVAALRTRHDGYRRALATEPRASDVVVGAFLMPPVEPGSVASVIYFNNAGYLGMCGHGTIGVIATLQYLGRISEGVHRLDTPVGTVTCTLRSHGEVSIENVVSYRHLKGVGVDVDGFGSVTGDVAWGGNWFFLVDAHDRKLDIGEVDELTRFSGAVRRALVRDGVTGRDRAEIDHIELYGAPSRDSYDCRNFVLCPGNAYDRSPCGTGTSARLACLAADGALAEGAPWRQESIVGSVFEGSYRRAAGGVIPTITGQAFVCAEGSAILDPEDPFCWGIR